MAKPVVSEALACDSRGDLDSRYCDANGDLIADSPTDPARVKNPDTRVFSFTPVEDPSVYQNAFSDLLEPPGIPPLGCCSPRRA